MSRAPEVSIVMPAWRTRGDWLRAAVASALGGQDCPLELIVVDDGSPEALAPALSSIEDERLTVLRVEHCGPYAARNAGLAVARGAFVRFVDSDDVLEPGSTERLLALARSGPDVIAYGDTVLCDAELRPVSTISTALEGRVEEACLLGTFDVRVVSMLFPRAVVDAAGPWEPAFPVSGDWDFVLRALEHGRVRRDPAVETYYRRHAGSVTRLADIEAGEFARHAVVRRYFERHPERRGSRLERRALAALYLDRAAAYAGAGRTGAALARLRRAAPLDPPGALRSGARVLRMAAGRAARRA